MKKELQERNRLRTKRLEMVPFHKRYVEDLYELWNDFNVIKYTYNPHCKTITECEKRIDVFIEHTDLELMNNFVILLEEHAIGIIGSPIIDKEQNVLGLYYQLARKHWGKGYISEAMCAFMEHIKKQLPNAHFKVEAVSDNKASIKILKKFGFKTVETKKAGFTLHGFCCNLVEFEKP